MKLNFDPKAFKVGMRTFKTIIAVGLPITLFELLHRQPAVLAAIAAVFTLRTEHEASVKFGRIRLFGNTLGVIIAILLTQIALWMNLPLPIYRVLGASLGILLIIVFCNAFNHPASVINSSATFFVVFLNTPKEHLLDYGANRILDAIIGSAIAILVNRLLPNPQAKKQAQ